MSPVPPSARYDLGGCTITLLHGGGLRLDGGAMFGVIPKPLWSRNTPCDDRNRIQLACNCLLVEWSGENDRRAIVECGHGSKYAEKERKLFAIDVDHWLLPSLQTADIDPATITDVFVTHLHFDHAGGLTRPADETETPPPAGKPPDASNPNPARECGAGPATRVAGSDARRVIAHSDLVATFPNAFVHVQKQEFDDARAHFGIMTQTYREENFAPIDESDAWRLHSGEAEPLPGIRLIPTPGHTRGHQSILIVGRERSALFVGDVMPTAAHVGAAYNMGYDLFPLDNAATKQRLLKTAAERDWLIVIDHEPNTPVATVVPDGKHFRLHPAT